MELLSFRRRHLSDQRRVQLLGEESVEKAATGGGSGQACLQPVAHRRQFIDFGDDAAMSWLYPFVIRGDY
jgi:hypothetical protein